MSDESKALGEGGTGSVLVPPRYTNAGGVTMRCPNCGATVAIGDDGPPATCPACEYALPVRKFAADFEIKSVTEAKTGTLVIEGYGNTWEEDRDGETVVKDAFDNTIAEFLTNPVLLLNHDKHKIIGGVVGLETDHKGLRVLAEVDKPPAGAEGWAHKAYADIKNGRLKTFSMGGIFHRSKDVDGKIYRVDLLEMSVVTIPSNKTSLFRVAAEKGFDPSQPFVLKSAGIHPTVGAKRMGEETKNEQGGGDVVTINKKDWDATQSLVNQLADEKAARDRDAEVERRAKEALEVEAKEAAAQAEAKAAREAEIREAVDERIKALRSGASTGTKMMHYAPSGAGQPGGKSSDSGRIVDFMAHLVKAKRGDTKSYDWLIEQDAKAAEAYGLKAYAEATSAGGGYLVPPHYLQSGLAEFRLAQAKIRGLCTVIPGIGTNSVLIPRETGISAVGWTAENAAKPSTDATFGQISVGIYVLAGIAKVSKQLMADSTPAVDMIVRRGLGKALGQAEDVAFINGNGVGQPTGILQTGGILTGAVGTKLWSSIAGAIATIQANYFANPTAILAHPRDVNTLRTTTDTSGRPIFTPNYWVGGGPQASGPVTFLGTGAVGELDANFRMSPPDGYVYGLPVFSDANIPTNLGGGTNETRMIIAAWDEAWIFEREGVSMDVSGEAGTSFEQNQFWFRAEERVGFTAARQPSAFYVMTGLTPGAGL